MPALPNVLAAMQSIQRDSGDLIALLRIEVVKSPNGVNAELEACIDIVRYILERSNEYIQALPTIVRSSTKPAAENYLGESRFPLRPS